MASTITNIQRFLPNQIPGCVIWFDAADRGTLGFSGSAVSTWTSKGSASLTATSVGGGSILYSNYNGYPSLYFNGSSTKLTTGTISSYGTSGTTWLTASVNLTPVVSNSTPVDASVVFATLAATNPEKSIRYNFPPQFVTYTFNNGQIRGGRTNNDNGIRGLIDSGPSMYAFVNGTDITESQLSATYQAGVNQSFQLGQWNTGWLLGHIQEVLVYNTPLSIPQYRFVEGYLAWKWGFQNSLIASHPYKNYPPYALPPFPTPPSIPRVISRNSFQPNQISGLAVWLDAYLVNGTRMPDNNSQVSTWVNLANQSANFTQATSSRQPTFLMNSVNMKYPSLFFNSSNSAASIQYLYNGTNLQNTRDASFFFVSQYINVGGDQTQIDQRKATNGTPMRCFKANQNQIRDAAGNLYTMNLTAPANTLVMRSYRDTLNASAGYLNGTQVTSSSGTYDQQVADNYGILVGCHFDSFNNNTIAGLTFAKVYISEVLVYNSFLSLFNLQRVEGYLAWKWGLQGSLPANHPYKLFPPTS